MLEFWDWKSGSCSRCRPPTHTWIFRSLSTFSTISGSILANFLVHFRRRRDLTALLMTDADCVIASISVTSL